MVRSMCMFLMLGRSMIVTVAVFERRGDAASQYNQTNRKTNDQTYELLHFISSK